MSIQRKISGRPDDLVSYVIEGTNEFGGKTAEFIVQAPDLVGIWVKSPPPNGYIQLKVSDLLEWLRVTGFLPDPELDEKVEVLADALLAAGLPDKGLEEAARHMLVSGLVTLPEKSE